MKKFVNTFLTLSFIIALALTVWMYYLSNNSIGDIKFNDQEDDSSFVICDKDVVLQYYEVGTNYKGGVKTIRKEIYSFLEKEELNFENKSGYITFRFIVNCNGETGRFRIKVINENLQEDKFDVLKINKLKLALKNLINWNPGKIRNSNVDSYCLIKFKIENGKITDIF